MNSPKKHVVWGVEGEKYPLIDSVKYYFVGKAIKRRMPRRIPGQPVHFLDVGCGYNARLLYQLKDNYDQGYGIDFEVSEKVKQNPKLTFYEGSLYDRMPEIPDNSFDFITFFSVIEHLEDPTEALTQSYRLLKPKGRIFFNTPSWIGKWVLEHIVSNEILDPGAAIRRQYDTHKMYFSLRDIWPILVKAGFVSSKIKIWKSNFLCSISGYAEKPA